MINVNFHYTSLLWNSLKPLEEKVKVVSAGLLILQQLPVESHSGSLLNSCVSCVRHVSRCWAFPRLRILSTPLSSSQTALQCYTCHSPSCHPINVLYFSTLLSVQFPSSCFLLPPPPPPSSLSFHLILRPPLFPCRPPSHRIECESIWSLHAPFSAPSPPEMLGVLLWTVEQAFALWGFCLLCEVFSQIAAFHSPARHITPLCVLAYASVFGNALMLLGPVNLSTVCAHF